MSEHNDPKLSERERELEMIIDRALGQSQQSEDTEIDDFEVNDFEQAAAMLDIAIASSHSAEMPVNLADRLKSQVAQYPDQSNTTVHDQEQHDDTKPLQFSERSSLDPSATNWIPWMVAAASILIATVSILMPRGTQAEVDLDAQRSALIAETPEDMLTRWDWISTDDPAVVGDVIGDVVWSDSLNKGYMRISGLAINDPSLEQYQLWIFDAANPTGDLPQFGEGLLTQRPIDGGVFDIGSVDEIIIEIDAKLRVDQAAAFAITVEPPGGVVVSDRSRVPLLALAP